MGVVPFQIHVEPSVLENLQSRLRRTRWARVTEKPGWVSGTDPDYLRALIGHWQQGYDWRHHEAQLNGLPQFKADVRGANLHFVHVKGRGPRPLPLLLLHGWPDSFYRFHKVIPTFADPAGQGGDAQDAFDVVVPSLPGFGFTGAVPRAGHGPSSRPSRHHAELLWRLMTDVLGYQQFAVAGGDGGSVLAQIMAIDHPQSVVGIHLSDLGWHVYDVDPSALSRAEQRYLEAANKQRMADGAYALVQMTQPRTLAAGLNDSPVGLASWIVDRFHSWSDAGGDLDTRFSKDELLTNIMLYWVTQTIGSSIFNYFAEARSPSLTPAERVERPVGMALFPAEPGGIPPRSFAERTLNVQRWTEMPIGGHFGALEEPQLFAEDVAKFFRPLRAVQQREDRTGGHHVASTL